MSLVAIANELWDHILYMIHSSSASNNSSASSGDGSGGNPSGGPGGGPGGNSHSAIGLADSGNNSQDNNNNSHNQSNNSAYNADEATRNERQEGKKLYREIERQLLFQEVNFYDVRLEPKVNVGPSNPFAKK